MNFFPTPQALNNSNIIRVDFTGNRRFEESLKYSDKAHINKSVQIVVGYADGDLTKPFTCMNKHFARDYGCSMRSATRNFESMLNGGFIKLIDFYFKHGYGQVRTFVLTQKTIELAEKIRMISLVDIGAAGFTIPETTSYQHIFSLADPFEEEYLPSEKEINENLTRLPKALIVKPPKSEYKNKFSCSEEAFTMAAEIIKGGGHYTFLNGPNGLVVKQDFTRRLGMRLEQWRFSEDPDSAIQSGLDLMADLCRADLSSDRNVINNLNRYFNRSGIKASRKAKAIIDGLAKVEVPKPEAPKPPPAPEPTQETQEEEGIIEVVKEEDPKDICVATSFSEKELACLKHNGFPHKMIDKQHYDTLRSMFVDMFQAA